jgi:hypothetical protein
MIKLSSISKRKAKKYCDRLNKMYRKQLNKLYCDYRNHLKKAENSKKKIKKFKLQFRLK